MVSETDIEQSQQIAALTKDVGVPPTPTHTGSFFCSGLGVYGILISMYLRFSAYQLQRKCPTHPCVFLVFLVVTGHSKCVWQTLLCLVIYVMQRRPVLGG